MFCEVARRGSFTGAAAALHYTQSGISRRVAALERATGGSLFARQARGVRLTPAGVALHHHALDILGRMDAAAEEVAAVRHGTGGRLRIGSFATANAVLLPTVLGDFRRSWPGVDTSVVEDLTSALVVALRAGDIDIAVVSDYPSGSVPADGLQLVHLCDDPLLVALPPGHRLAGADAVSLADLADESWIEAAPAAAPPCWPWPPPAPGSCPARTSPCPGGPPSRGSSPPGWGSPSCPAWPPRRCGQTSCCAPCATSGHDGACTSPGPPASTRS